MRRAAILAVALGATLGLYVAVPMLLHAPPPPRAPWDGPALADLAPEEVRIGGGDVDLAALVIAPPDPVAVVVVIHGSGPSRREHGWYTRLAEYLTGRGIAVVLPDKRGSEGSGGDWRTASMQVLAGDALRVVRFAAERWPGVPVGLFGASQGGWVAPVAAAGAPAVAFVIDQSGAAVPARDQLVFEEANTLVAAGMPRPAARVVAPASAWIIRAFRQKPLWDAIGDFDPLDHWARVAQPALVVYGALDEADNVPVARSAARLAGLGKTTLRVVILPGLGHSMNAPGGGTVSPDFLRLVADFATPPHGG